MLLAIDVGNTNIVFALFDGADKRGQWRSATDPRRTADEYAVWLGNLMAMRGFDPHAIQNAIIASVVPDATFNLRRLCEEHLRCQPMVVGETGVDLGIRIAVDRPEEVGADRLVNAVAGYDRYGGPAILIDFGSATTFDVVGNDGAYLGGVIAPAANHSLDALHRVAAKLPKVDIVRPRSVIGTGTVTAMQSGIYFGYLGLIEGLVSRIQAELGTSSRVIATGGLASMFADATDSIEVADPDMTLRGLLLIFQRNQERSQRDACSRRGALPAPGRGGRIRLQLHPLSSPGRVAGH